MIKKKFYITTSIIYTNAFPHIGFALETVQADVLARYHRILGEDVFFLTGTDEHGVKVARAAEEEKKKPEEFVDEITKKVKEFKNILNISNDDFIRTTDQKRHWPAVKKLWQRLKENGDIYKKKYKGFYCSGCEIFILEKDLVDGKCCIHQREPELVEEENYFFKLSKYSKKIEKIIKKNEIKIIPQSRKNEILSLIGQGLEDISFSRSRKTLKWGIPVPDDDSQTIYVWADALTNYISALDYAKESEKFKKFWPADIHIIGKDILRFHAAIWTGMLLSLKLPLPRAIFIHGFISSDGQKMSKSLGNVVYPSELVQKYGTDAVRYFLLREIPPTEDGDYTRQKFEKRYNADLAAGLGNLVARIITLAKKFKIQKSPPTGRQAKPKIQTPKFQTIINKTWKNWKKSLEEFKFNETLITIWDLISFCDKLIEKEKPWETKDPKVISDLLFTLEKITQLLEPFLPETSEKIIKQLKTKKSQPLFPRCK